MKILVTGGSGFIGSNFVIKQIKNNNTVLNFDKLTYAGNNDNLIEVADNSNYSFIKGDVSNLKDTKNAINMFQPDCIVHFAAESHVDRSIEKPLEFINTNILGTANLLDSSFNYWKKFNKNFRFIHISTDEVFGSLGNNNLFTESTPYNPNSPYSSSKAGSDFLVRAWFRTYGFPSIITNCSNNYGPFQFPEKLIPLMIANCLDNKSLPIYGKGLNIRDWLYVDDHCNAIDAVIENGVLGETYNIGGNNELTNIDIVNIICLYLDDLRPRIDQKSYLDLITFVTDRPGHDFRYAIDASKIKKELKWLPNENFNSGIKKTIDWYIKNEDWWRKIQKNNYKQERLGLNEL